MIKNDHKKIKYSMNSEMIIMKNYYCERSEKKSK